MGWCQFSDNSMPCGSVRVGLEPHILGRLGSGPRVGVGVTSRGYFGRRLVSRGGFVSWGLSPRIIGRNSRVRVMVTIFHHFSALIHLWMVSFSAENKHRTLHCAGMYHCAVFKVIFTARFPLFICYIDLLSVVFIGLTAFYLIVAVIVLSCCIILRAHVLKYV